MRAWFSIIFGVFFILVIVAIAGAWQINRVLNGLHLDTFSYEIETLNLHQIKFSELSFVHTTETTQQLIQLHDLAVDWKWQSLLLPEFNHVVIEQAQITYVELSDSKRTSLEKSQSIFPLPNSWSIPKSLPEQIHIQRLTLTLPCARGVCSIAGVLDALKIKTGAVTTGITFKFKASPTEALNVEHQLNLDATYNLEQNLPMLSVTFSLDNSVNVQLETRLKRQNEIYWSGNLKVDSTYPNEWWGAYFNSRNIQLGTQAHNQETAASNINMDTEWELALTPLINLPKTASTSEWIKALSGRLLLDAKIPAPLSIQNIGDFSGNINLDVDISAGHLNRYTFIADITANNLVVPNEFQLRGMAADTAHLKIKSTMDSVASLNALPVEFSGDTQGAFNTNLVGRVLADALTKKIIVEKLALSVKAKQFNPLAGIELNNVSADVHVNGYWQPEKFELQISAPSQIAADVLAQNFSIAAQSTQFSTAQLNIAGELVNNTIAWPRLRFTTNASLKGGKFQHPQINAKAWYWRGKTQGIFSDFDITGDLGVTGNSGVDSLLVVRHSVKRSASELIIDWKIPDVFLLAANPFSDALHVWPPLLSLSQGNINSNGKLIFDLEKNKLTNSNVELQLEDISGVYDTAVFEGLSSRVKIVTTENTLAISTEKLTVNHINKGFDIGPLVTTARYKSNLDRLTQGALDLQNFSGSAMGGSISTGAQQFNFSHETQKFTLELKNINLANLLKQYSSNELSGTGLISGAVPFEINPEGVRVAAGAVAAAAPGGLIQMKSERASAMAKKQPNMKFIVDALNDFHYTALASQINYDEKGKLLLNIKLDGRSPALEHGRAVNLNINLEEDVPAMLASIQLSSKVTDIVKKRLQERIQKKEIPEKNQLKVTP